MLFITQGKTNWKYIILVIVLAIIVGGGVFIIARQEFPMISSFVFPKSCRSTHDSIEKEFDDANFCNQDSDCKTMSLGGQYITFGCYKFVNKLTNEQTLYDKMEKYYQKCTSPIDECMPTPESVCVNNKCTKKTEDEATKEQVCLNSGGTVSTSSCCKSSGDFPNSCLIDACGCSLTDSHQVKICGCGEGKCFDGEKCVFSEELMTVKVFFSNSQLDPEFSCNKVFPIEKELPKTLGVAKTALEELFKGPTEEEKSQGYVSWFSQETKDILKSVKVESDTAYVDLKDIRQIIPNVSSSCGSAEFLAEVETTLKQFSAADRVIIAIEGKPETFYGWIQIGCAKENDFCDETPFK